MVIASHCTKGWWGAALVGEGHMVYMGKDGSAVLLPVVEQLILRREGVGVDVDVEMEMKINVDQTKSL